MAPVREIKQKAELDKLIKDDKLVAVQAHAEWCGPCKVIAPKFDEQAVDEANKDVVFARFDIDDVPDLANELGIRSVPAFFFFKDGNKVDNVSGANPPALTKAVKTLTSSAGEF